MDMPKSSYSLPSLRKIYHHEIKGIDWGGRFLATASFSKVELWDGKEKPRKEIKIPSNTSNYHLKSINLQWNSPSTSLALANERLNIWDVESQEIIFQSGVFNENIQMKNKPLSWHKSVDKLATANRVNCQDVVEIWDINSRDPKALSLKGHRESVFSIDWSSKEHYIACAGKDGVLNIWDIRMPREIYAQVKNLKKSPFSIRWDPSGHTITYPTANGEIILDNVFYLNNRKILTGHVGFFNSSFSWSLDNQVLISTGDNTIRLWSVYNSQQISCIHTRDPASDINCARNAMVSIKPEYHSLDIATIGIRGRNEILAVWNFNDLNQQIEQENIFYCQSALRPMTLGEISITNPLTGRGLLAPPMEEPNAISVRAPQLPDEILRDIFWMQHEGHLSKSTISQAINNLHAYPEEMQDKRQTLDQQLFNAISTNDTLTARKLLQIRKNRMFELTEPPLPDLSSLPIKPEIHEIFFKISPQFLEKCIIYPNVAITIEHECPLLDFNIDQCMDGSQKFYSLKDNNGEELLSLAVKSKANQSINFLLSQNFDPEVKDQENITPLIHAIITNQRTVQRNLMLKILTKRLTQLRQLGFLFNIEAPSLITRITANTLMDKTKINAFYCFILEMELFAQIGKDLELRRSLKSYLKKATHKSLSAFIDEEFMIYHEESINLISEQYYLINDFFKTLNPQPTTHLDSPSPERPGSAPYLMPKQLEQTSPNPPEAMFPENEIPAPNPLTLDNAPQDENTQDLYYVNSSAVNPHEDILEEPLHSQEPPPQACSKSPRRATLNPYEKPNRVSALSSPNKENLNNDPSPNTFSEKALRKNFTDDPIDEAETKTSKPSRKRKLSFEN